MIQDAIGLYFRMDSANAIAILTMKARIALNRVEEAKLRSYLQSEPPSDMTRWVEGDLAVLICELQSQEEDLAILEAGT